MPSRPAATILDAAPRAAAQHHTSCTTSATPSLPQQHTNKSRSMSASCLPTRGGTELLCHGKASTIKEHNLSLAASSLPLFCASDATHCLPPTIYPYPATTDHVPPLRPLPLRTFATVTTTPTTATVYTTAPTDKVAPLLPLPLRCTLPPTPLRHPPELSRLDSTTLYI